VLSALALLTCIGAGTIGGVFFAFSTFVMKALAEAPAEHGIGAMQRINVVVLNPLFLGAFFGTAVLSVRCAVAALLSWSTSRSLLLRAAAALYLGGTFFVTVAFNVPRNERLSRLDAASPAAAEYWPRYVGEWTYWNHVRTAASLASAACAAGSLAA